MTETESMDIVQQIGDLMDTTEPQERRDQQSHGVTVNVNASDNCVVVGDRIEINIHVGDRKSGHAAKDKLGPQLWENGDRSVAEETE